MAQAHVRSFMLRQAGILWLSPICACKTAGVEIECNNGRFAEGKGEINRLRACRDRKAKDVNHPRGPAVDFVRNLVSLVVSRPRQKEMQVRGLKSDVNIRIPSNAVSLGRHV